MFSEQDAQEISWSGSTGFYVNQGSFCLFEKPVVALIKKTEQGRRDHAPSRSPSCQETSNAEPLEKFNCEREDWWTDCRLLTANELEFRDKMQRQMEFQLVQQQSIGSLFKLSD
jgi:hypothetical protein